MSELDVAGQPQAVEANENESGKKRGYWAIVKRHSTGAVDIVYAERQHQILQTLAEDEDIKETVEIIRGVAKEFRVDVKIVRSVQLM